MPKASIDHPLAALRRLPQAGSITAQHAEIWWTHMQARETRGAVGSGLTLEQHIRRLGGFGASEIGLLVGERRGLYSPFGTARELIREKLLQQLPDPGDEHTHRGLVMEPLIREQFLHQSGAVRREDLTRQVATHTSARWPWMIATPDDLIEISDTLGVVDYKAPAEPLTEISLAHACQLHQIKLLAEDRGLPIQFQAIVAWNHRRGAPDVFLCESDPSLEQELIEAGEHYWNRYVLTGELPDWPTRETLALNLADLAPEAKAEIEGLAERYLRLDLLAKEAKTLTDTARGRLLERCHDHQLTQTIATGPVTVKALAVWNTDAIEARLDKAARAAFARPQWDISALVALVRQLGGDPDSARAPGDPALNPLDLDAAAQWLIEQRGLPEAALRETVYKSSISRAKAHHALLESIRTTAMGTVHDFNATPASVPTSGSSSPSP